MAKRANPPELTNEADGSEVVADRATRIEALKLRAAELQWDPEHLREFLSDLVDML